MMWKTGEGERFFQHFEYNRELNRMRRKKNIMEDDDADSTSDDDSLSDDGIESDSDC